MKFSQKRLKLLLIKAQLYCIMRQIKKTYLYNSRPSLNARMPVIKATTRATIIWLSEMEVIFL